jgi:hypothetical protein
VEATNTSLAIALSISYSSWYTAFSKLIIAFAFKLDNYLCHKLSFSSCVSYIVSQSFEESLSIWIEKNGKDRQQEHTSQAGGYVFLIIFLKN